MEDVLAALRGQHDELAALVGPLSSGQWAQPSRCPGWSVSDVVLHLAQTDELALASLDGSFTARVEALARGAAPAADVDGWAGAVVDKERGEPPGEVHGRWRRAAGALDDRLARSDPHDRVPWVAGTLSVHTLATTRLAECWIHTVDVAEGVGVEPAPTDRLRFVARLAWRTLPYAVARAGRELHGPVAFHLLGPAGDRWDLDPAEPALTTLTGPALDLCTVAGQRAVAGDTALRAEGPDADTVLELVRTFA